VGQQSFAYVPVSETAKHPHGPVVVPVFRVGLFRGVGLGLRTCELEACCRAAGVLLSFSLEVHQRSKIWGPCNSG